MGQSAERADGRRCCGRGGSFFLSFSIVLLWLCRHLFGVGVAIAVAFTSCKVLPLSLPI